MREVLLLLISTPLCIAALFRPVYGLYGYVWFALMRPDYLAWVAGKYPISMTMAITTLLGSMVRPSAFMVLLRSPITRGLLLMQVPIGLSVLTAVDPRLSYEPYMAYVNIIIMALLVPVLVRNERNLRRMILVCTFSIGVIGTKFGVWAIMQGGIQFTSGLGGFMSDNNTLALAMAMAAGLLWYGRHMVSSRLARGTLFIMFFATVAAVIMSHSRGGALSVLIVLLMIAARSGRAVRATALIAVLLAPPVYLVRETWFARLSTLEAPQQEASAMSRLVYAQSALKLWADYPFTGVGFGTENQRLVWHRYVPPQYAEGAQVIHNTYLQILADCGIFAFVLYTALLFGTVVALQRSVRRMRARDLAAAAYPMAIQSALVAFAVGSTFLSRVSFDFYYILLMLASAWLRVETTLEPHPGAAEDSEAEAEHAALA